MRNVMTNAARNAYSDAIMQNIPRLLGLLDRNLHSPTYGCFDRQFWHYKVMDFPAARMQEASLILALLCKNKYPKNAFYKNENIKNWATAAMLFWTSLQSRNGSFSEWYPNENSFVATALSAYAISEAFLLLRNEMSGKEKETIESALKKSSEWLMKNNDLTASSQQAGAACALYNTSLIFGEEKYMEACRRKIALLQSNSSAEGWYGEYGGADTGYLSVFLDYIAKIHKVAKETELRKETTATLKNGYKFMAHFMQPDFSFGGEYGSRNTEYVVPHGAELASRFSADAAFVSWCALQNLKRNGFNYDDRYFCYYGYTYLQAYDDYNPKKIRRIQQPSRIFRDAGLQIISTPRIYCIISLRKGVVKAFDKKRGVKILDDCGISGKTAGGKCISTQHFRKEYAAKTVQNAVKISGSFYEMPSLLPSPLKMILSRGFQATIGMSQGISRKSKLLLRNRLISGGKPVPVQFTRKVIVEKDSVSIEDTINNPKRIQIQSMSIGGKFSFIYIPSSRYFFVGDAASSPDNLHSKELSKLNSGGEVAVMRRFKA